MCKIELVARLKDSKSVLELLQRRGLVELTSCEDEGLVRLATDEGIRQFSKSVSSLEASLEALDKYAPEKTGLFGAFSPKTEYGTDEFEKKSEGLEKALHVARKVLRKRDDISECEDKAAKARLTAEMLAGWTELDIRTDFSGSDNTSAFIGTFLRQFGEDELSELLGEGVYIETVFSDRRHTNCFILCEKNKNAEVAEKLRTLGFEPMQETFGCTPSERIDKCMREEKELREQIRRLASEIADLAAYRRDFEFYIDYLNLRKEKYAALSKVGMTENIFVVRGYVPEKYSGKLKEELEKSYECVVSFAEPEENEDVPVLLENSRFSAPVEGITEMYALPGKRDIDPTSVMSFFYYLFFGMMLSDAGYGLLMIIGTAIALKKFTLGEKMKKTLRMFQYCGISTVFWGAMFGSWFGDIVQVVAREFFGKEIGSIALWFQPLDDPMKLLLFSFLLGILHLFLGLITNFRILWKRGQKLDAVFDVIPIMMTVTGVAPIAAGILTSGIPAIVSTVGGYLAIAGVVLIVLTAGRSSKSIPMRFFGGIYGLYNVATGYLSDILSYSRLLALGLATGSIAGVINLIGTMPSNPVIKAIMLVVVFMVGHTANLAINLLGAYVHTDRLQFVELFSKFYEGGGRAFEPLKTETKYIRIKEEKNNE